MSIKKIVLIMEQKDNSIKKSSLELISAANKVSGGSAELIVLLNGTDPKKAGEQLGAYGVSKIYSFAGGASADFKKAGNEIFVKGISEIVEKEMPGCIFASANPFGKDLLPRVSARLNRSYVSDCVDLRVEGQPIFVKPILAGKVLADAKLMGEGPFLASLRPNVMPQPGLSANKKTPELISLKAQLAANEIKSVLKEIKAGKAEKLDLQEASVIVSGGRGIKAAENFKILEELARVVGSAVGASRAAVDSEYATQDMQVGQTGKVVNPNLYIACGISGQIQHLAGMRTSKVIVAINKDPEAPIFKYADYGIVGDLFEVVPALTEEFKKLLKE